MSQKWLLGCKISPDASYMLKLGQNGYFIVVLQKIMFTLMKNVIGAIYESKMITKLLKVSSLSWQTSKGTCIMKLFKRNYA